VPAPSGAFAHDMYALPPHEPSLVMKMAAETVVAVGMDTCMS
jgi:hypothetical protein